MSSVLKLPTIFSTKRMVSCLVTLCLLSISVDQAEAQFGARLGRLMQGGPALQPPQRLLPQRIVPFGSAQTISGQRLGGDQGWRVFSGQGRMIRPMNGIALGQGTMLQGKMFRQGIASSPTSRANSRGFFVDGRRGVSSGRGVFYPQRRVQPMPTPSPRMLSNAAAATQANATSLPVQTVLAAPQDALAETKQSQIDLSALPAKSSEIDKENKQGVASALADASSKQKSRDIRIAYPASAESPLKYQLNGTEFSVKPGNSIVLEPAAKWEITFSAGEKFGDRSAELQAGQNYVFENSKDEGWVLMQGQAEQTKPEIKTETPIAPTEAAPKDVPKTGSTILKK